MGMIFFFSRCLTLLPGNIPEIFQLVLGSGQQQNRSDQQLESEKSFIFMLHHRV